MQRLIILTEDCSIDTIIKIGEKYWKNLFINNTKMYYTKLGKFYVTKFNPDVELYEDYIQQNNKPFIQTITKELLLILVGQLSGLNLLEGQDYETIEDIGVIFRPLSDEKISEVLKLVE